jgi:hypothetical protein
MGAIYNFENVGVARHSLLLHRKGNTALEPDDTDEDFGQVLKDTLMTVHRCSDTGLFEQGFRVALMPSTR